MRERRRERKRVGGREGEEKEESLCFGALAYFDNHSLLFGPSSHGVLGARRHYFLIHYLPFKLQEQAVRPAF